MKTRNFNWFDPINHKVLFGVQVLVNGKWLNASRDHKPMLFDNETDREKARAVLRKQKLEKK